MTIFVLRALLTDTFNDDLLHVSVPSSAGSLALEKKNAEADDRGNYTKSQLPQFNTSAANPECSEETARTYAAGTSSVVTRIRMENLHWTLQH